MRDFEEEIFYAFRCKFSNDIERILRASQKMEMSEYSMDVPVLTLPVRAGVKMMYDQGMGHHVIRGVITNKDPAKQLNVQRLFSTRKFESNRDKAIAIGFLFDEAKQMMLKRLAEDEMEKNLIRR
jgi:hypothetical protein